MPRPLSTRPCALASMAATALAVLGCWISGLIVYSRYDGRWGDFPSPQQAPGLTSTVRSACCCCCSLCTFPGLLLEPWARSRPAAESAIPWPLWALAWPSGTGKLMQEDWLRQGELNHLASFPAPRWPGCPDSPSTWPGSRWRQPCTGADWPLLASMTNPAVKKGDLPATGRAQVRRFLRRGSEAS